MSSDFSATPNDSLDAAFLLVSRQLDEELTGQEMSQLEKLESQWPLETGSFRRQCQNLRAQLQTAPAQNITGLLFTSQPAMVAKPEEQWPVRRHSRAQQLIVGTTTAILCCGLLVAVFGPVDRSAQFTMASGQRSLPQRESFRDAPQPLDGIPSGGTPMADSLAFSPATRASKDPENPVVLRSEMSDTASAIAVADDTAANTSTDDMITPLVQSDNWNVVVVKVDGQDRDQAMDRIASIVMEHGLRLQRSNGEGRSEWLGVVLTSADGASEDVVTAMENGLSESSTSRGFAESRMSPEASSKIIAAVRESLQYPTRSELHHGRIFVALPTAPLIAGSVRSSGTAEPAPAAAVQNRLVEATSSAEAISDRKSPETLAKGSSAENFSNTRPSVTLVVFEFPPHQ